MLNWCSEHNGPQRHTMSLGLLVVMRPYECEEGFFLWWSLWKTDMLEWCIVNTWKLCAYGDKRFPCSLQTYINQVHPPYKCHFSHKPPELYTTLPPYHKINSRPSYL